MTTALVVASEEKRRALSPNQVTTVAQIISTSKMFSDAREASRAAVKVLAGSEMGVGPVNSMMGIFWVKERLTYSANFMASVIQASDAPGNNLRFRYEVDRLDHSGASLTFYKRDIETREWLKLGTETFTLEDAKRARLAGDNWTKYPKNMCFARAMSNGAKFYCPGIFSGTPYTPDELSDDARIDAEGNWTISEPTVATVVPDMPETAAGRLKEIQDLVLQTETDASKVCSHFGVDDLTKLDDDEQRTTILMLRSKLP